MSGNPPAVRLYHLDRPNPPKLLAGPAVFEGSLLGEQNKSLSQYNRDDDPRLPAFGRTLFIGVLSQSGVGEQWRRLRHAHGANLRVYLRLDSSNQKERDELQALPWELLTEGLKPFATVASVLRTVDLPPGSDGFGPVWPVRVFIINAGDPTQEGIKADQEIWNIRRALRNAEHSFDLEVYDLAKEPEFDLNKLVGAMNRWPGGPHIVHFIGHSVAGALQCYVIKTQTYYKWTLAQIANVVGQLPDLRLVYANACRSQQNGPDPATPWSVATALLTKSAAVIAMQTDVSGEAAALCAGQFYTHLAKGLSVDGALQKARQALLNKFKETSRESYAPVLTTRVWAEHILPVRDFQWEESKHASWQNALKENWAHFVNQHPHRRKLFGALFDPASSPSGLVILGEAGVGKSWLVKWSAYSMALHRIKVYYLPAEASLDWLELLRRLRDGSGTLYCSGLDQAQRHEFNWKLNHLAQGQIPPPYEPGLAVQDAGDPHAVIIRRALQVNGFVSALCEAMVHALQEQSRQTPIVLVLDKPPLPMLKALKEPLLDPLIQATNVGRAIRVIICCDPGLWKGCEDQMLDFSGWHQIVVSEIDEQQITHVSTELLRLQYPHSDTSVVEKILAEATPTPMTAGALYDLCKLLGVRFRLHGP